MPRTELLKEIGDSFGKKSTVVVHGITGTGKTRLAESYARKQAETKQVYWIDVSREGLIEAYIRLALGLMLITEDDLKHGLGEQTAIGTVKGYFKEHMNSLLVLDDVTIEDDLVYGTDSGNISFIPEGEVQVLITSQSDIFSEAELIEIDQLRPEEAIELLRGRVGQAADEKLLSELAERLFYHPLLVDMTGSYIQKMALRNKRKPLNAIISEEIVKLKESSKHLPSGRKEAIRQEVERRWETNLARAREEDEHVDKTLGICAYLAPTQIPLEWFKEELRESFGILEAFGFCHRDSEAGYVSMHALVQLMSRRKDIEGSKLKHIYSFLIDRKYHNPPICSFYDTEKETMARLFDLAPHFTSLEKHAEEKGINTEDRVTALLRMGSFYREAGRLQTSKLCLEKALNLSSEPVNRNIFLNLGNLHLSLGELDEAREMFSKSGDLLAQGLIPLSCGEFPEAKIYYEDVLKKLESQPDVIGETDKRLYEGYALRHLGEAQTGLSNYSEAIKSLTESSLKFSEIPNNLEAANSSVLLGQAYEKDNKQNEARISYEKASKLFHELHNQAINPNRVKAECQLALLMDNPNDPRGIDQKHHAKIAIKLFNKLEEGKRKDSLKTLIDSVQEKFRISS